MPLPVQGNADAREALSRLGKANIGAWWGGRPNGVRRLRPWGAGRRADEFFRGEIGGGKEVNRLPAMPEVTR